VSAVRRRFSVQNSLLVEKQLESSFRAQCTVRVAGMEVAATPVTEGNTSHMEEGMLVQEPCTPVDRSVEA
jgi:hypothetical protein